MLDLKVIRDNPRQVAQAAKNKGIKVEVEKVLDLDQRHRQLITRVGELRAERNRLSAAMKTKRDLDLLKTAQKLKEDLKQEEQKLRQVSGELDQFLARLPNIPADEVPVGPDEKSNQVVRIWGEPPNFPFQPKDHLELGCRLDLIDFDRGAKVAGFRGYFLKNEAVLMEMGLMLYSLNKLIEKGFTPLIPPVMVRKFCLFGTGWLPWGEKEVYPLNGTDLFLAATAEVPVTAYHADEILSESELPKRYVAFSACFRPEAGSYGKDIKGLYRLHQFNKVEQLILCHNDLDESRRWHEELSANAEEILQDLKLPHRVVMMSTGEMGEPQVKKYDIETWMPSRQGYGETQSNSIMGDFQSRRLNIRYRDRGGELKYVHTLNNTAIASPRILIPILENYQQEDGSVVVPEILRPYVGKEVIRPNSQT